jgi:hypothetical protein
MNIRFHMSGYGQYGDFSLVSPDMRMMGEARM